MAEKKCFNWNLIENCNVINGMLKEEVKVFDMRYF